MTQEQPKPFQIKGYRKKELIAMYGTTWKTFKKWTEKVPDLGEYNGKSYTPNQVKLIVQHIGYPWN